MSIRWEWVRCAMFYLYPNLRWMSFLVSADCALHHGALSQLQTCRFRCVGNRVGGFKPAWRRRSTSMPSRLAIERCPKLTPSPSRRRERYIKAVWERST